MDFTTLIDLASERLDSSVLAANDEFFAPKENLLKASDPVFVEKKYTGSGKWMDGWETRRRRTHGYDWCVLRLGVPGVIRGVVVDTRHFKGNYPEHCSIEACAVDGHPDVKHLLQATTQWLEVLPKSPLQGDSLNSFAIADPHRFTHLRLNIFPDGGVARLRVHGEAIPDGKKMRGEVDLAAIENGAIALECSDMFFGNRNHLIMPGRANGMSDGWETRRRRGPGHDWMIIRLAASGAIDRLEVDTSHFKGNAPASCSLETCDAISDAEAMAAGQPGKPAWREALPNTHLLPHTRHFFEEELRVTGPATHVRFNIFPDGGVARLRVHGKLSVQGRMNTGLRRFNALFPEAAEARMLSCCASTKWARAMTERRPFRDAREMMEEADRIWRDGSREDWLEAFGGHPRLGEKHAKRKQSGEAHRWSNQEQAGAHFAPEETLDALAEANRVYEKKFGYIFIVCASEKTAEEMLALLRARLTNDPKAELLAAAEEQRRITRLRLEKLLQS